MKKRSVFRNRQALRGGSYSLGMTALVLAILIVVNLFAAELPATLTKLDISESKLYSITSNTKAVVHALDKDVTIYWIVQSDAEDKIIENLLAKYDSLSSHIDVVRKNPDVFPTFAEKYTDEEVSNNSLVVECGDRYRYIAYSDMYEYEYDFDYYSYSYTYTTSGFDGEGAITSAIDYVVTDDLPLLYVLEGHGESDLPATFSDAVDKANIQVQSLSLLTLESVPEDADALLIYDPQSDISEEEKTMLADYAAGGGKLLVLAGPVKDAQLTNLDALLSDYGVRVEEGLVIESNQSNYVWGYPYCLVPELESSDVTDPLIEEKYSAVLPLAQGMTITGTSDATVTALLTTSEEAFSKVAGYDLTTYDKEEDDIDGPFTLALSVSISGGGQIIRFSSSEFLNDRYNSLSSGANVDLAMNALSALIGEREALSIRSKSMNYNYLTIDSSSASALQLFMIGILPLGYLAVGITVLVRRRKEQNETR